MSILGKLTTDEFLQQYWQKRPLLIRQAIPGFQSPLSPDEVAGLACEEEIESRLVLEQGKQGPWELRHGPFCDQDFAGLPETHWSLLVQGLDHYLPSVAQLRDQFDFIPSWRIDDVMVSFAPQHGSVGPHLDNYDVFLLQGHGRRRWYINQDSYTVNDFIPGLSLRILAEFNAEQDWVLEPGDMLYLPPGVAHHGIAQDDCLTYSIGFRAPTHTELLSSYSDDIEDTAARYYTDPDLLRQESCGEIKAEHIRRIRELLLSSITDNNEFSRWFGRYITEDPAMQESVDDEAPTAQELEQLFRQQGCLLRPGNKRLSYLEEDHGIRLFFAGNDIQCPVSQRPLIRYLCENHRLEYLGWQSLAENDQAMELLTQLYAAGCFYFDD